MPSAQPIRPSTTMVPMPSPPPPIGIAETAAAAAAAFAAAILDVAAFRQVVHSAWRSLLGSPGKPLLDRFA